MKSEKTGASEGVMAFSKASFGGVIADQLQARIELHVLKHIVAKGHGLISAPKVSNEKPSHSHVSCYPSRHPHLFRNS
jgi:hypothetical protein